MLSFYVHCSVVTEFYQNDRVKWGRVEVIGSKQLAFITVGGFVVQLNISMSETDWTVLSGVGLFEVLGFGSTVIYSAVYCCHLLSLFITYKLSSYTKNQK